MVHPRRPARSTLPLSPRSVLVAVCLEGLIIGAGFLVVDSRTVGPRSLVLRVDTESSEDAEALVEELQEAPQEATLEPVATTELATTEIPDLPVSFVDAVPEDPPEPDLLPPEFDDRAADWLARVREPVTEPEPEI